MIDFKTFVGKQEKQRRPWLFVQKAKGKGPGYHAPHLGRPGRRGGSRPRSAGGQSIVHSGIRKQAVKELLGNTEVSIAGSSFWGKEASITKLVDDYMRGNPEADRKLVERVAAKSAAKLHRPPKSHMEMGRGRTFVHNHPGASAALSRQDVTAARKFGFKRLVIVTERGDTVEITRPARGWPKGKIPHTSFEAHDAFFLKAGSKVKRSKVSQVELTRKIAEWGRE